LSLSGSLPQREAGLVDGDLVAARVSDAHLGGVTVTGSRAGQADQ